MIDALTAINLMPSVQRREQLFQEKLEEISSLIETAAREDKNMLTINLYENESYRIVRELENNGYYVLKHNESLKEDDGLRRYKYTIRWGN